MYSPLSAAVTNSRNKVSLLAFNRPRFLSSSSFLFEECLLPYTPTKILQAKEGFLGGGGVPGQRRLRCPPIRIFLLLFPKYCDYRHGVHCIIVEVNKKVFSFKGISQWGANLG